MDSALVIAGFVFVQVMLLILGLTYYVDYRKKHSNLARRIKKEKATLGPTVSTTDVPSGLNALKKEVMRIISSLGDRFKPKSEKELSSARKNLLKAGYRSENAPVVFFGIKSFLAILMLILGFPLIRMLSPSISSAQTLLFSVMLALVGFYLLPSLWLSITISGRRKAMEEGFPDALDLLVVCVEAGLGLDAAISRVGEEIKSVHKVLSEEFILLCLELRAGKQHHSALKNLALRTDLKDVSSLVTLLIQTDKFGTSLADALRVQSDFMRIKRYQRAEEMAAKLPIKLLLPLILFIFPSLFVVILGPAGINIFRILGAR